MWSSSHIDEMKLSLVSVSALVFYLLKNEWNVKEDWLVVDDMMEKFNNINSRKNSTCKKWKSFGSNIGNKEDTLANKNATLTEKRLIYIF